MTELKRYALQFIHVYKIEMPVDKIEWFIHSNMLEYGTMSGMFALTCPGNKSAGFSIRWEIHTNGFNPGLLKHEYSHYLFDNNIPQQNNSAFFVEGCVEYVTNLNDDNLYKQRVNAAKAVKDSLDYKSLIVRNRDFYGKYSDDNYAASGIFVKYLIDTFGVDSFKKYCIASDKEEAAKTIFKMDFNAIINGYKQWLDNIWCSSLLLIIV